MDYDGDDDRRENHWHLDRRLNITHLISTILIAAAAGGFIMKFDQRLTALEVKAESSVAYQTETNRRLSQQLQGINEKLDRLIERLAEQ